jgi:hypothetical protein
MPPSRSALGWMHANAGHLYIYKEPSALALMMVCCKAALGPRG